MLNLDQSFQEEVWPRRIWTPLIYPEDALRERCDSLVQKLSR